MTDHEFLFYGHSSDYWFRVRTSGEDEARWESIDAIRHICSPHTSIPLFLDTLRNDTYWRARALAAHAIYDLLFDLEFRPLLVPAIPTLIAALDDSSFEVCQQVIFILELFGAAAVESLPKLQGIAISDDHQLSGAAREAIDAIETSRTLGES